MFESALGVIKIATSEKLLHIGVGLTDDWLLWETVIANGNPFGLQHTVTTGSISAFHRSIKGGENRVYRGFIQLDASINPGNSGGPLLNIEGSLIGINTAIFKQAEGIGFAIPCLFYTFDAADDLLSVVLGVRRRIKNKKSTTTDDKGTH